VIRHYSKLTLHLASTFNPDWVQGSTSVLGQYAYAPPLYEVTREDNAPVYVVRHVRTGEACEIPVAVTRWALIAPPAAPAVFDPDPIAEAPTAVAKRGPGRPRKTPEAA
jgi:hypothetical protein